MILNHKVFGSSNNKIIILHGLLGSLDNWVTVGKNLASHGFEIIHGFEPMGLKPCVRTHGIEPTGANPWVRTCTGINAGGGLTPPNCIRRYGGG